MTTVDTLFAGQAAAALIPLARAFVRFAPPSSAKDHLWQRVIDPYLAWRDHRFVADTVAGRMGGTTADILQQYLYYFGVWEPAVTGFVRRRLRAGDGFVDVGANVGYFSLLAARRVGSGGHVTAVEAAPAVFRALTRNLRRNPTAVRALALAAADKPGTLRLFAGDAGNCGASTVVPGGANHTPAAEVEAAPLSAILTPGEVAAARLVKIDVEGAEAAVLDGLAAVMPRLRPDCEFLVEVHPDMLARAGRSSAEVFGRFQSWGFVPYLVENDYDATAYLWPTPPARPQRLRELPTWDANVVFSRTDAEQL